MVVKKYLDAPYGLIALAVFFETVSCWAKGISCYWRFKNNNNYETKHLTAWILLRIKGEVEKRWSDKAS